MNPRRLTQYDLLAPGAKAVGPNGLPLQQALQCHSAPVSNTERQRQFRQRNPGYYGRIKAKQRAASKAYLKRWREAERVKAILYAYRTMPLMLPAPVEPIEIPGITTIPRRDEIPAFAMAELRQQRRAA